MSINSLKAYTETMEVFRGVIFLLEGTRGMLESIFLIIVYLV